MARALRRWAARLVYGPGSAESLGAELARLSITRALVLCGATLGQDAGLIARLVNASDGRIATVFAGVRAHSPVVSINEAVAAARRGGVDGFVALGGGSAVVTARAVAILLAEHDDIEALAARREPDGTWRSPRLDEPKAPIVALPTVPTTAVATAGAALTSPGRQGRLALFDPKARVRTVLLDDTLLASAPQALVRSAVWNGVAMAIEGLLSPQANPLSDALMAHSVRVQLGYLDEETSSSRVEVALAGIMTGEGAELASVGLTAALSHVIGHRFAASNGDLDAVFLPHVLAMLAQRGWPVEDRLKAVGLPSLAELASRVADAGVPSLRDIGVEPADIPAIATAARGDYAYSTSPVPLRPEDVELVLTEALWSA